MFIGLYCSSRLTTTKVVIYLKNPTEKTETAVFATNSNRNGKLKPHRPNSNQDIGFHAVMQLSTA